MSTTKRQDAIRPKLRRRTGRGRGSTAAAIGAVIAVGATCFTTTAASGASKRSTSKPTTNAPTISTTLPPPSTKAADLRATEPIRIVVTYAETVNFSPGTRSVFRAAQARAAAQNEGGGIKGRNVEVIGCNTKLDEATSEACARQAVLLKADAFIAGQAISLPANGNPQGVPDAPNTLPVMEQAGVAWFGSFLTAGGPEATSPVAFPFSSSATAVAGDAIALVDTGCRRLAFLGGGVGTSREFFRKGLASRGLEPVFEALFPFADPSVIVPALAARNVDCVYLGTTEGGVFNFRKAVELSGQQFRAAWVADFATEKGLALMGPSADGDIVTGSVPMILDAANPVVSAYRTELDRYFPGERYGIGAMGVWGATDLLFQAMRGIDGNIDAASTLRSLRAFKATTRVFGEVDFTKERANKQYARLFMTNAFPYRILNGKPVRLDPQSLAVLFDAP